MPESTIVQKIVFQATISRLMTNTSASTVSVTHLVVGANFAEAERLILEFYNNSNEFAHLFRKITQIVDYTGSYGTFIM